MAQEIVNVSLPVVTNKVEEVLSNYTTAHYQTALSSKILREKLVAYVLRRMPTFYTTAETSHSCSAENLTHCFSQEQQIIMDDLIHEGIQHLTARQAPWESITQGAPQSCGSLPSHWFG
ncbi:hypothetical protein PN498_12935 [Oscillatoria sp. CS-180]|uniref:hypothetical protein n=1 Tax=Oscillatoria sp. CS-180 TaxID=3021720 RepID=UPI00232F42EA|nr:hypothetical protein [Oscillatoria sp. CS-180]MDB9526897.1 hypothetical protein [Oscillatoria sp. CS-180]